MLPSARHCLALPPLPLRTRGATAQRPHRAAHRALQRPSYVGLSRPPGRRRGVSEGLQPMAPAHPAFGVEQDLLPACAEYHEEALAKVQGAGCGRGGRHGTTALSADGCCSLQYLSALWKRKRDHSAFCRGKALRWAKPRGVGPEVGPPPGTLTQQKQDPGHWCSSGPGLPGHRQDTRRGVSTSPPTPKNALKRLYQKSDGVDTLPRIGSHPHPLAWACPGAPFGSSAGLAGLARISVTLCRAAMEAALAWR